LKKEEAPELPHKGEWGRGKHGPEGGDWREKIFGERT